MREVRTARTVLSSRVAAEGGRHPRSPKSPPPQQLSRRAILGACFTATGLASRPPPWLGMSISVEAAQLNDRLFRSGRAAACLGMQSNGTATQSGRVGFFS